MWIKLARSLALAGLFCGPAVLPPRCVAQDTSPPKLDDRKVEPQYDDTFSGPVVEFSADKIIVSRSILGQPAEKRKFLIRPDTKIEGSLKVKARVTVGFVASDEGDIAKLIVVRQQKK